MDRPHLLLLLPLCVVMLAACEPRGLPQKPKTQDVPAAAASSPQPGFFPAHVSRGGSLSISKDAVASR
jgi:hypothetical protein